MFQIEAPGLAPPATFEMDTAWYVCDLTEIKASGASIGKICDSRHKLQEGVLHKIADHTYQP